MSKPKAKRFYKGVTTAKSKNGFVIKLDERTLKTPGKEILTAPSQKLAKLIAQEWEAQGEHIRPENMPLTRLMNVALELTPHNRPKLINEARSYAATDLLCYRDGPGALGRHQAENWDPVLDWAKGRGIHLKATPSIIAITQDETSLDRLEQFAAQQDDLYLTLFLHLTAVFGSAILAMAVLEKHLSGSQAFDLSRLDARWQIAHWGEDEEDKERSETIATEVLALCKILGK